MEKYQDLFSDWASVQHEYRTDHPEPDEVIVAYYSYEDYSGYSVVIYRDQGRYCLVTGSHCSCYGLEDQFEPEEYETGELLIASLEKGRGWLSEETQAFVIERLRSYSVA